MEKSKKKRKRINIINTELMATTNYGKNFLLYIAYGEDCKKISKTRKLFP